MRAKRTLGIDAKKDAKSCEQRGDWELIQERRRIRKTERNIIKEKARERYKVGDGKVKTKGA